MHIIIVYSYVAICKVIFTLQIGFSLFHCISLYKINCKLYSTTGAAFQFFVVNATFLWFFHVCTIFYKMAYPVSSQNNKKQQFVAHIMLTITGGKLVNLH